MENIKYRPTLERFLLLTLFVVLIGFLTVYNSTRFFSLGTDSAAYVDLIRVIAENGTMVSSVFSSFYSVIPLLAASSETYCSSELTSLYSKSSFLQWHPYLIAYGLALPVKYLGVSALHITAVINAINISGSLILIYWFLRRQGLVFWECMSFIFAILVSAFWVGTISGQLYFDRLFILPGLAIVFLCVEKWEKNFRVWATIFCIISLISISISERAALYTCMLTFGYWLLSNEKRFEGKGLAILLVGIAGLAYLFIYMKFFQNSLYYNGMGWHSAIHNLSYAIFPEGVLFDRTMIWIGVVSPMLILAFVNWRYGLLVVAALMPNLLVSVGGAEKTGFATHYHAGYIPFLIGFGAIGYATLVNKARGSNSLGISWFNNSKKSLLISAVVISSGLVTSQLSEVRQVYETIIGSASFNAMLNKRKTFTEFLGSIPNDQSISSPEWTMPTLVALGISKIDYMPIGIGSNRFIIAQYILPSTLPEITSYLDSSTKKQIATCMQEKLVNNYLAKSESLIDGSRYILYEKKL